MSVSSLNEPARMENTRLASDPSGAKARALAIERRFQLKW